MATIRAYDSIDILDFGGSVGDVVYSDEDTLVIATDDGTSYYLGDFRYPGGEWKGTINSLLFFDVFDDLVYEIRGLELKTRYATVEVSRARAVRTALEDGDRIIGSPEGDRLAGFDGDDLIDGKRGDDVLLGQDGSDTLLGSTGDDNIKGGNGKDEIVGGRGDDALWGGEQRDTFFFSGRDGNDVIRDFVDRHDKIAIEGTPTRFRDLEVVYFEGDAFISFDDTGITVREGEFTISKGDFLFM